MEKIFKGMDNAPDAINGNFNELADPKRDVTVNDLTANGDIRGKQQKTSQTFKACGNGVTVVVQRSGDTVNLTGYGNLPWDTLNGWSDIDMQIPLGFRPILEQNMTAWVGNTAVFLNVVTDGKVFNQGMWVQIGNDNNHTGFNSQFRVWATYTTNDSWPA
ncbi:hypothetical protein FEFB_09860 [Fructobacillus sp. EFB-N1]|uniref:hypothetical protein n=1 Tax=Fructobacillus sp. EFB-N1 TaxID=1658766 RepID=UPI00064DA282|nr:hypothetical protein [Fructobacillus sp. EFB-N1]KMK53312.1 hypothetical protein FEFB_09860 [Fructobacillus sp. EFB-N1]